MNRKGQAQLWEIVLLLAFIVGIYMWMQYKKPSQSNQFNDQAQQHQTTTEVKYYSLLNLLPWSWEGCAPKRPMGAVK